MAEENKIPEISPLIQNTFEPVDSFAELEDPLTTQDAVSKLFESTGVFLESFELINELNTLGIKKESIGGEVFWLIKLKE